MGAADRTYDAFASSRGLTMVDRFNPGPVTPLLARGANLAPAASGQLSDEIPGTIARLESEFTFNVVFCEVPESQPFVPRLQCERKGRLTSNTHYGFEMRTSRLWTESEVLNERYRVTVSPFQDDNWLRQLFAPSFIDYLAHVPPADFSFELAYGSLLCSIEEDDPDEAMLVELWSAAATVAGRVRDESRE